MTRSEARLEFAYLHQLIRELSSRPLDDHEISPVFREYNETLTRIQQISQAFPAQIRLPFLV